jgi:uroporphyrinogen III methyltransferase/synthase
MVSPDGTHVCLMALANLEPVCAGLIAAGLSPDTPAALLERGSLPGERRLFASLGSLPALAAEAGFHSPALLVAGKVVEEGESQAENLPLSGKIILVAGSLDPVRRLSWLLAAAGAAVTPYPCLEQVAIPPEGGWWERLQSAAWLVFTSPFGADLFFQQLAAVGKDLRDLPRVSLAAVGEATAAVLARRGARTDLVPERHNAQGLAAALATRVAPGERIILFRAREANPDLETGLAAAGLSFEAIAAYQSQPLDPGLPGLGEALARGDFSAALFLSGRAAEIFRQQHPEFDPSRLPAFTLGENARQVAESLGFSCVASPDSSLASLASLVQARLGGQGD